MAFEGKLRSNEIFAAVYNMIISQEVEGSNLSGTYSSLVDQARVDGGLNGDTKLYYDTDVLASSAWGNDAEAANLLAIHRPAAPEVQAITLDKFRQIALTVDDYLSKRAFSTEGAFSQFNSVMLGWLRDTKRVYDATTYNAFVGTTYTDTGKQSETVDITAAVGDKTGVEKLQLEGMAIAEKIADILTDLKDVSRDYNDYGNLRSFADGDIKIIWNAAWVNKIRKVDLPTIFNKEGLVDKFAQEILPARYFGTVNAKAAAVTASEERRSLIEQTIGDHHYFAGDKIAVGDTPAANTSYNVDGTVICKIVTKLPPYRSAFEVGTSFFNPKSLTTNHYLTWGHNSLVHLMGKPFITVKSK